MLFNVAGRTVEVSQYPYTNVDVSGCYAYNVCSIQILKGGEDSCRGGGGLGPPPPPPPPSSPM